eukprot:415218_1
MAALKPTSKAVDSTENEEKQEINQPPEKISLPAVDPSILEKLNKEMQELYQYKCKHKINDDGSVTFWPTPDCKPCQQPKHKSKMSMNHSILSDMNCNKVEAHSNPSDEIVQTGGKTSSFIVSSLTAWSEHYPFRFKPEHIWLLVLQGVAVHVDQCAEKLRDKYVTHQGKKKLLISRDEFVLGSAKNDWIGVINEFVQQIDKYTVNDTVKLFNCDFTCSTLTEQIATKVTIMDICKNYFSYGMMTCCGFPQITLDGTKADWVKLKDKCKKLLNEKVDKEFGKQWGDALLPLLDRFIVAFDGEIDGVFWNSMIKRGSTGGSGSYSYYTGWFNILFPFLKERWNGYCVPYSMERAYVEQGFTLHGSGGWGREAGGDMNKYPTGLASAPVEWTYYGKKLNLKFLAGFVGFTQDAKTLEITPNVGWCIAHEMSKKEIEAKEAKNAKEKWWM